MNQDISLIKKEVTRILPQIRKIRRHLHAHPELSLKEFKTSKFIRSRLERLDLKLHRPFLGTDVVAIMKGKGTGKNVTLRADMDALPLHEQRALPYSSVADNVMHACGHDGHMSMLLGAAMILDSLKDRFYGTVRFVFQPGEEVAAAGKELVRKGALDNPKPDAVLALHSWPDMLAGSISSKPGPLMAAADFFRITIRGEGGHGSAPEKSVDTVLTSGRVVNGLCMFSPRKISALDSLVISVCSIHGGSSANVIPREVVLEGTVRYLTKKVGALVPGLIKNVVSAECRYTGAEYDFEYIRSYISTINDPDIVRACGEVARSCLGKSLWNELSDPVMGSEDFSFYLDRHPGAMFFLGMGEESPQLHSDSFNFNDRALGNGILFLVLSTLKLLQ